MKKTFWSFGLVLTALVVLVAPGATPAEEAAGELPALQVAVPSPEAASAPAEAVPFDLSAALAAPAASPATGVPETLDLGPERLACDPPECTSSEDCGGGRCRAKCCV